MSRVLVEAALGAALLFLLVDAPTAQSESSPRREVTPSSLPRPDAAAFAGHWFRGEAELTRFELRQMRYGEERRGDAVMIFVKEDFDPKSQVKVEKPGPRSIPVLKLNFTRKFLTGIYPYSTMTSVFTPIELGERPEAVKSSCSVQEWCGHVWLQLNRRDDGYVATGHSYFEGEGDESRELPLVQLEDALFTRVRLAPWTLPVGEFRVVPGALFTRLRHVPLQARQARGGLRELRPATDAEPAVLAYRVEQPSIGRNLEIRFRGRFPWEITEFREELPGGRVTTGRATHRKMLAYWTRNDDASRSERAGLGLPTRN